MITAIIPAYNAARTLAETLQSVVDQSLPPAEIILVDDGSSDGTGDLSMLAAHGIRVIQQANSGAAAALNTGIAAASNPFLAFLDADDLWPQDKLKQQYAVLAQSPEIAGVFGQVEAFVCPTITAEESNRWDVDAASGPGWLLGALLIRTTVAQQIPLDPTLPAGYFIDWIDQLRRAGHDFDMRPEIALYRRLHGASMAHRSDAMKQGFLEMARKAMARRRGGDDAT